MTDTLPQDPEKYIFVDTETRAFPDLPDPRWGDIKKTSVDRYSYSSKVIMLQYAIGTGPVKVVAAKDFESTFRWRDMPPDLLDAMARMYQGDAWMVAFNSRFDRLVMNHGMIASRRAAQIPVRCMLDASAQAAASNLPGQLDRAHKAIGGAGKLPDGKHMIKKFCIPDGPLSVASPADAPEDWQTFCDYGEQDIEALRDVFLQTRPLSIWEWEDFWANEVINDRGMPMDRPYLVAAAQLAGELQAAANDRVDEYTHGECYSVNQHIALAKHVHATLADTEGASEILTKRYAEDEEGALVPDKISLERDRVVKLIALLERIDREDGLTDAEYDMLQLLEVREYGASATPKKFAKALGMLDGRDRLGGQYQFNGAQQTGRFSSRGLQMHNLTRKALPNEEEVICDILEMYDNEHA